MHKECLAGYLRSQWKRYLLGQPTTVLITGFVLSTSPTRKLARNIWWVCPPVRLYCNEYIDAYSSTRVHATLATRSQSNQTLPGPCCCTRYSTSVDRLDVVCHNMYVYFRGVSIRIQIQIPQTGHFLSQLQYNSCSQLVYAHSFTMVTSYNVPGILATPYCSTSQLVGKYVYEADAYWKRTRTLPYVTCVLP